MFGSKVYINDDIPVISSFRKSLQEKKLDGGVMETEVKLSSNTIYTNPEDYFTNFTLKNINELNDIKKPIGCVVVATIIKIKPEQGWYYLACRKCNGKAAETTKTHVESETGHLPEPFQCVKCKGVSDVYNRIKVQVQVQDSTGTICFCLFQREVTRLTNKSASYLLTKIKKGEECNTYPNELETLLQKKCAFKIKISSFNLDKNYHTYTVDIANDDADVINAVLEKSDHAQGKHDDKGNAKTDTIHKTDKSQGSSLSTTVTVLKRKVDSEEDDLLIISSTSNNAQEAPKLKIPKVEKD